MEMATDTRIAHANRALGRRFFEEQDRVRGGPVEELCAPEYQACLGGNPPTDRVGHERFATAFYAGFPDLAHTIEEVFATDDRIAVRFVLRGTHGGSFFGIPPTNRLVMIAAHVLLHVHDGKITRLQGIFDEAGLLRQLGVLQS